MASRTPNDKHAADPAARSGATSHPEGPNDLDDLETEVARAVRHSVACALRAGGAAARDWSVLLGEVLEAGAELAGTIQGVARGAIAGVQDERGDLAQAAHEIVRTAMQQAHLARADVALVARRAIAGIAQGAAEAGGDAAASSRAAVRSALRTAAGLGVIAAETMRVTLADVMDPLEPIQVADEPDPLNDRS